mmetsp:Transcript_11040/g.20417  ORF Transcript_11040/g.20417 Transcript_11040/m.20417 type:complete len:190 (+) Transcript_11040:360-929(+)
MSKNHYHVLDVSPTASYDEIKARFRSLSLQYHPDKQQSNRNKSIHGKQHEQDNGSTPEDKFQAIQLAWEVLRDDIRRRAYDRDLLQQQLYEKSRTTGALELDYHNDLEEAIDEDTGERFLVYDCRCGEEIHIDVQEEEETNTTDATDNSNARIPEKLNGLLVDCSGCCFVYRVVVGSKEQKDDGEGDMI